MRGKSSSAESLLVSNHDQIATHCDPLRPESLDNPVKSAKVKRLTLTNIRSGALFMKNVYEVLRQKEMELTRLEKEVEALRLVAPLLSEEKEMNLEMAKSVLPTAVNGPHPPIRIPSPPPAPPPRPPRPPTSCL